MPDAELTQAEADLLLAMGKVRETDEEWEYPQTGGSLTIPLVSEDRRERFLLDIRRGRIDLSKHTLQDRARQVVVLVRLDVGGAPHRNPDDAEVACPHVHLYRENYGDKWAFPVPSDCFVDLGDGWQTLQDFMRYCNVTNAPAFRRGLYI